MKICERNIRAALAMSRTTAAGDLTAERLLLQISL
jgi:hypothetical protein